MRWLPLLSWPVLLLVASLGFAPLSVGQVTAQTCAPAVEARTSTLRTEGGQIAAVRVSLQAGTAPRSDNTLRALRLTRAENAMVTIDGTPRAVPSTISLPGSAAALSFDVTRQAPGRPFLVRFVVQDGCGERPSFAGAGLGVVTPDTGPDHEVTATPTPTRTPTPTATGTATPSQTPTATTSATVPPTMTTAHPTQDPAPSGFVTRSGPDFVLDGAPFRFVGANMYNAAGDPAIYQCGPWMSDPEVELDAWFARARADFGGRVVRFWAFQRYTNGGTDWRGLDRVMRLANKHGLKVIPVLENHWADCTAGGVKLDTWYAGGYQQPDGEHALAYQEYVRRVVTRYRDEPAIFAWMLMNEAEGRTASGQDAAEALYTFARDMSAYVKALDPAHLVTLGTIGGGQPGVHGANFERLHGLPTIDFADYHDYGHNDDPLPGAPVSLGAPIQSAIYRLDGSWAWAQDDYRVNQARTWETLTWTLPAGAQPTMRIGVIVPGAYRGNVYLDEIRIGNRLFDFEDGTTQGWQSQSASVALSAATEQRANGTRSLRVGFDQADGQTALIWVPAIAGDGPGTTVSLRLYVDTPGTPTPYNTLASAMYKARHWLNKPLIVGEAGMTACGSWHGSQAETGASRATKIDAKLGAFFGNGGAGYLVWAWEPNNSCNYAFGPGDPLNGVLKRAGGLLNP